ncbi:hypothetical protein Ndes2526B_g02329 [Nannochloris sp. 'desiccata']|nr:hypothetical protein KSW81_003342 [Chlorella desiccata (nom. nud.)]KAH7623035.1 putative Regulator of nonsense transcripts 1 [Chlorella desiccata (nom. nud.)]
MVPPLSTPLQFKFEIESLIKASNKRLQCSKLSLTSHKVAYQTSKPIQGGLASRQPKPSKIAASASISSSASSSSTSGGQQTLILAANAVRQRLEMCVQAEAEEQRQQLEAAYGKASDKQLVSRGIALTGLRARPVGRMLGEFVWKLEVENPNEQLPRHKFKAGGNVTIRQMKANRSEGLDASLLEVTPTHLLLTVSPKVVSKLTQMSSNIRFRIEQGIQDVTTRRQLAALAQLGTFSEESRRQEKVVRAILLGSPRAPDLSAEPPEWMKSFSWQADAKRAIQGATGINKSQRMAIAGAVTRTFTIWQGPPGTGKTRTLLSYLALLCSLASTSQRKKELGTILAVADTNAAADNLLQGLLEYGLKVVRVGRVAQVRSELRYACLEAVAERSPLGKSASGLRDQAARMLTQVQEAAAEGRATERDVQQTQREANRLWAQAEAQLIEASEAVLEGCQIVVGTCASAGEPRLAERQFRVVAIDEATQATEPSTLVALTKGAECVVMAGDHAQLPPTVVSRLATQNGLDVSLFARLQNEGLPSLILNTQYRMHPAISVFPSRQFYQGKIESGVAAEERPLPKSSSFEWPNPNLPVILLSADDADERASTGPLAGSPSNTAIGESSGGSSYRNPGQAEVSVRAVRGLLSDPTVASIAMLTPYNGQVRLLNTRFQAEFPDDVDSGRIIVSSVDGYQGREADVVVFSTVRCNPKRNLGFLADARRMNVAITRARRGLVVIGSERTLETSSHWSAWLNWVKKHKAVAAAEEVTC